ncbi:SAM-dependent methyltransferase [Alcaligenes endophyticus]|uniref:SAM-dependent methyltransferase n=1 Tax=Alcaligenes endophyticus TaxID=1929088 RepID=A0ABT8EHY1_9BURK|nr:SAM-dependent methyltransferase [Alcaligenes endophyticus]MCX5592165.1 SAM-dependent methyltransferase [Alcaligenes endophyticus]MDN4120812.1 SAM-dependent methyltransferase [Alcaligenes endophyticus]
MSSKGTLHLIPVSLSPVSSTFWLPHSVQQLAAGLTTYIAENAKTARAFLKQIETAHPLQDITIHTLDKRGTPDTELRSWLQTALNGEDIGLVSEAGCPAVADPGSIAVAMAHQLGIPVKPHVGPSSILLSLMASGLEGQQFTFHGYAPVESGARSKQLKAWELQSKQLKQTQILIETPYRNPGMYTALCQQLHPDTRLCIARDLTGAQEWIRTQTIQKWRQASPPALDKVPCIFLFLAKA